MRTLFNNPDVPALEGDTVDMLEASSPPTDVQIMTLEVISMEEADLLNQEASVSSDKADSMLSEAERILEVSDALEDLALVAGNITKATPTETALIETIGNMAAAGSDVDPQLLVPAMEESIGDKINVASIRETARVIWENIQKFLKQVWESIENFFTNLLATLPRMKRALDELERRVEIATRAGTPKNDKIKLSHSLVNLYVDGKPVSTEHELSAGYETLGKTVKWAYSSYVDSVVSRGETIARAVSNINPANPGKAVEELRTNLKKARPDAVPGGHGVDTERFPGFATTIGSPLLGNVSIACKYYDDNKNDTTSLAALDRYRNSRCELIPTNEKAGSPVSEMEFTVLSTATMGTLINDMREMLDTLSNYKYGAKAKEIMATKKVIMAASEKAQRVVSDLEKGNEGHQATVVNYRALLNFNAAYARWAQTPAMPLMRHTITITKMMMTMVQKSLSQYEVDKTVAMPSRPQPV